MQKITHIAFIMDGNRRYAKKNNIELKRAYSLGMEQFINIIKYQIEFNIKNTSFFALSTHNYQKRSKLELKTIFDLMTDFLEDTKIKDFLISNQIKVKVRGNKENLKNNSSFNKNTFKKFEKKFEEYNAQIKKPKYFANIALNYDGQDEILNSFKQLQKQNKTEITIQDIKENLFFNDVEAPQIIVRPGDAPRLSGFLLFDSEYSEIYFTKKLWPELNKEDFKEIIDWFNNIKRNFGK